jgi:hypothetical protein
MRDNGRGLHENENEYNQFPRRIKGIILSVAVK